MRMATWFSVQLTQSGGSTTSFGFVPIYLELADGRTVNLGRAIWWNSSVEQKVPLKKV